MVRCKTYFASMKTHRDIIEKWPTVGEFAADIGVSENTARAMKRRNSIRGIYWHDIVAAAKRRGFEGVTHETLACAATAKVAA